ncbi:MAG: ABC transporter substrate-binding protein, partial [Acidimicrobiales bacterium]|nr:ABC transporter substrate-binding protein [Acidimicrobiales bacterium]
LGVSTAAAIHDGDPYTNGLAQAFADAFEAAGGTITGFTAVNKGDTDMVPVLTEIASGSPEMLFFPIFQPEGDFIVQQVRGVSGMETTILMAADGLLNSNYMALEETEGMYFSGPDIRYGANTNQSTGKTADSFLAAYTEEWGEDPAAPFWAHSYDATTLLLDAIAAASYDDDGTLVIDRAGVREHLNNVTDYSGIIGLITCDAFGDCGSQKITVIGHADSTDVSASNANVVYEYAPGGSSLGEGHLVVPAPVPQRGGTLRYAIEADVDGLNPTSSAISTSGYVMGVAVFDTLATVSVDGDCIPGLAESFEPNEDYTSWTYKLREGIMFHDGNEVTAEDVVYSAEVQRNDPLVGLAVKPFYPTEGAFEALDRYTVRFNLLDSWANYCPTSQLAWVASKAWLEAALEDPTLDQQPVGSGPFRFDSRTEDSVTRFVRNEDYWGGEVWLDAVEYIPVPDPDTRTDLLLVGEVHALHTTSDENIEILENSDGIYNLRSAKPHGGSEGFIMLNSSVAPFDDIRARKALAYATPKQDYLTLITAGLGVSADQLFEPGSPYHNPAVKQEADMPDEAAAMAAEYCADLPENCSNGKINMEYMFVEGTVVGQRSAELMEKGWSVAFNVDFDLNNQQQHIQNAALGWYNAVAWRQFGSYWPEGDNVWLMCRTVGFISLNWPKYCDEERDALLWEATGTTDEAERAPLFQELAQKLHDDYLYIFLTHVQWTNSFADNVHGVCEAETLEGHRIFCPNDGIAGVRTLWLSED